jgi:hypothetical protein
LKAYSCPDANTFTSDDLTGRTLLPGVYCSASGQMLMSSTYVTLDGNNDWDSEFIFQTATTVVTEGSTFFILQNGAQAKNVYWAVGSSVTLGSSSRFVGNIVAHDSITFGSGSTLDGRGLAMVFVSFESGSSVTMPVETAPQHKVKPLFRLLPKR